MSVIVKNVHLRQAKDGKSFVTLELSGDLELVQSQNTGRFYGTAKKCFIASSFDLQQAKQFIGQKMSGSIIRVPSGPYEYTIPETNEVVLLSHSYAYQPDGMKPIPQRNSKTAEIDCIDDEIASQIGN